MPFHQEQIMSAQPEHGWTAMPLPEIRTAVQCNSSAMTRMSRRIGRISGQRMT